MTDIYIHNRYFTEKLINALLAGTVPIYFGAPDVAKYVNPKRFIYCDKIDHNKVMSYKFPVKHLCLFDLPLFNFMFTCK